MRAQVKLRSSVGDALAEVTPGELAAGPGLQILLELQSGLFLVELNDDESLPGAVRGRVPR